MIKIKTEKKIQLGIKEKNYIENELRVLNQRRRQMKTYIQKIYAILDGMSIEEAEKKFKARPAQALRKIVWGEKEWEKHKQQQNTS